MRRETFHKIRVLGFLQTPPKKNQILNRRSFGATSWVTNIAQKDVHHRRHEISSNIVSWLAMARFFCRYVGLSLLSRIKASFSGIN
jgi:hypothetical protein